MRAVELVSSLPLDDCLVRLQAATDSDKLWTWFVGSRPVVGRVSGRSVRLRKRIGFENAYQPILLGTLERHKGATVFRGKADERTFVTVLMAAWFSGVVLIGGVLSVAAIGEMIGVWAASMKGSLPLPLVPVIPILMLAFGIGFRRHGRWLASDEERFLIDFVADMLDAKELKKGSWADLDF